MPESRSKDVLLRELAEARAMAAEQLAGRETLRAAQLDLCILQTRHELQQQLQAAYRDLNLAQVQARSYEQQFEQATLQLEQATRQLERVTQSLPWKLAWPLRVLMRQVRLWRQGRPPTPEAQIISEAPPEHSPAPVTPPPDRPAVLVVLHDDPNDDTAFEGVDLCRLLSASYAVYVWLLTPSRQAAALAEIAHDVRLRPAGYDDSAQAITEVSAGLSFDFVVACGLETRPVLPALQAGRWPVVGVVPDTGRRPVSPTVLHAFALGTHCALFSSQDVLSQTHEVTHRLSGLTLAHFAWSAAPSSLTQPALPGEWVLPSSARRVVLGCGPVNYDSGLDLFIGTIVALHRQGQLPDDVHAVWVGRADLAPGGGDSMAFALGQLQRSGLQHRISVVAQPTDEERLLTHTVALLQPARREQLPALAVQALACGVPALCFDSAGGLAAALGQAGQGPDCVAPYPDVTGLAGLLATLITDPARQETCGAVARRLASERLGDEACRRQLAALGAQARAMTQQETDDAAQILASSRFVAHYVDPACPATVSREAAAGAYLRNWRTGYAPRKPGPGFHPGVYRALHPGLPVYTDPFADYLRHEAPDGPWHTPVIKAIGPQPAAPCGAVRTALHIHAYYPDLVPEILARLAWNATAPAIYVTVKSADDETMVREMLLSCPGGPHTVMRVSNSGRDIGPFLSGVGAHLCDHYDIIGHVHTKRSPHISDRGMVDRWRHFLLENLLGGAQSGAMADTIFAAMQADPSLGIVFPEDPAVCGWDQNEMAARLLATPLGIGALPEAFNFPVGTMFWIRPDVLRRFVDLNLDWADYPSEPLGADGSMLHAIERLLGIVPTAMSKRCAVTWVDGVTR